MLACGGHNTTDSHEECEVYKAKENKWEPISPYPYSPVPTVSPTAITTMSTPFSGHFIMNAPVVYHKHAFYMRIENLTIVFSIYLQFFHFRQAR